MVSLNALCEAVVWLFYQRWISTCCPTRISPGYAGHARARERPSPRDFRYRRPQLPRQPRPVKPTLRVIGQVIGAQPGIFYGASHLQGCDEIGVTFGIENLALAIQRVDLRRRVGQFALCIGKFAVRDL